METNKPITWDDIIRAQRKLQESKVKGPFFVRVPRNSPIAKKARRYNRYMRMINRYYKASKPERIKNGDTNSNTNPPE